MIRKNLPDDLKDYYDDLDKTNTSEWIDKVEILETKKIWGLVTRRLYRMPDIYIVNNTPQDIFMYHYSVGKKAPTIQCAPILGGEMIKKNGRWYGQFPIAKINATLISLFKRWNAFVVCTNNKAIFNTNSIEEFELELKNVVYNNIQALKFIKSMNETTDDIFAIGISLGGLTVAIMQGIEDSYKASGIMVAGGPLSEIIPYCIEESVVEFSSKMRQILNVNKKELSKALESIKTDPLRLAKYIPDNTVFNVTSENDISVPTETQKKLNDVIKPYKRIHVKWVKNLKFLKAINKLLTNGHYYTIGMFLYFLYEYVKFFNKIKKKNY